MKSPQKTTAVDMAGAPSQSMDTPTSRKMRLVREVLRPYRGWFIVVFIAMLFETAMSIAAPWPLKIIIDNVVGNTSCRSFWTGCGISPSANTRWRWPAWRLAAVVIAAIGAVAGYIDNYYTESVAQYVATTCASGSIIISSGSR